MVRPRRKALAEACCSAWPRAGWPRAAILPAAAYAAPTDWCAIAATGPGTLAGMGAVSRDPETDADTLPITATPSGAPTRPGEAFTAAAPPALCRGMAPMVESGA